MLAVKPDVAVRPDVVVKPERLASSSPGQSAAPPWARRFQAVGLERQSIATKAQQQRRRQRQQRQDNDNGMKHVRLGMNY
jgi:hypothetical protein